MQVEAIVKELEEDIERQSERYNYQKGQKEKLEETKKNKLTELSNCQQQRELLDKVNLLLQETSEYAREQARQQIELLVTQALQWVFGEDFSFQIEIEEQRNRPSAEFYVVSKQGDKKLKTKPQDARGGGVVDVVSLALRISILQSYQHPPLAGPLVLDEPAKHVSEEYIVSVTQFLKQVNEMFDRQILIVTHQQHLSQVADKAFKVQLKSGQSQLVDNIQS